METISSRFPFNLFDIRWFYSSIVSLHHSSSAGTHEAKPAPTVEDNDAALLCSKDDQNGGKKATASKIYNPDPVEMRRVFEKFDENQDGVICSAELRRFMMKLGFDISDEEVVALVKTVDENCDGSVDFDEFYSLYSSLTGSSTTACSTAGCTTEGCTGHTDGSDDHEDNLRDAFRVFDKDQDGFISVQELQSVLVSMDMSEGKSLKKCHQMIQSVDADGNGRVDFQEFKKMMFSNALQSP